MAEKKSKVKLDQDTFDTPTGITTTFETIYSYPDFNPNVTDDLYCICKGTQDPVGPYQRDVRREEKEKLKPPPVPPPKDEPIEPTVSTRLQFTLPYLGVPGAKYIPPELKGTRKMRRQRRQDLKDLLNFCEYEVVRMPSPIIASTIKDKIEKISPDISRAKVMPMKPSYVSSSSYMVGPTKSELQLRRPKSGIFINIGADEVESEVVSLVKPKKKRKKRIVKKRRPKIVPVEPAELPAVDMYDREEMEAMQWEDMEAEGFKDEHFQAVLMENKSTHVSDNLILGRYPDTLSVCSSATSMRKTEVDAYADVSFRDLPLVCKLVQTLRSQADQPTKKKKRYKKQILERHSFTRLKQKVAKEFCFKCVLGNMHQGDISFDVESRNKQWICMPATAFAYTHIKKHKEWSAKDIDEILEVGNQLYLDSTAEIHMHKDRKALAMGELQKHVIIGEYKILFDVMEPEFKGLVRSTNKKIFNLARGLKNFFARCQAGIFRSEDTTVLIWKPKKKCYCLFDAQPRCKTLHQDPNGYAIYMRMPKLKSIVTVLLERSSLFNSTYNICEIKMVKIVGKDVTDDMEYNKRLNTYSILNEKQAVVQASFDLGDKCFKFTRNKQALAMGVMALVYSRISPPHLWHKKTLDKIMIIGNKLYALCIIDLCCAEMHVDDIPAIVTLGPYIIELRVYKNLYADFLIKKGHCMFLLHLQSFLEKHTNAIAQIGKCYIVVWKQRDMFFTFDPYVRNKEGLKARVGTACATMNRDLETLVETVLLNFEDHDEIFYLHALQVLRIERDPDLEKIFPKYLMLHEIPADVFMQQKLRKSKKKAVEKSITVDQRRGALKKLLAGVEPEESHAEIQSNLESIMTAILPPFVTRFRAPDAPIRTIYDDMIIDLDSPSLSDTQISPKKYTPEDEEEMRIDDLDSFMLTQEELEMQEVGEEGGLSRMLMQRGEGEEEGKESVEPSHYAAASQVTSDELDPCFAGHYINTDLTYCYKLLPALELPTTTPSDRIITIDESMQIAQFTKLKGAYVDAEDGMQILRGTISVLDAGRRSGVDPNFLAPYACMMASAYDYEYPLRRWKPKTVDFMLEAALDMWYQYEAHVLKIEDFRFELEFNNLFCTLDKVFNTYIGDGLFDTFSGRRALDLFMEYHVFNKQDCGIIIMEYYACTVFFKSSVFYLYDPYNCDERGVVQHPRDPGVSCVMKFKNIDALLDRLVHNLSKRIIDNDPSQLDFRLLTLAKPVFIFEKKVDFLLGSGDQAGADDKKIEYTKSQEWLRASNYVTLPDGSQLVRGTLKVNDLGDDVEFIAPFMCIMASAVCEKYAIRTWSTDVIDFVIQAGFELYKKSKFRMDQLAELDIPKVTLGKADYKITVRYQFDAPMKTGVIRAALRNVIRDEREWALIVTEMYSCSVYQKNGIVYLFDPFQCNELGLDDGPTGTACVARFKELEDLVIRIMFNKGKREVPEKVEYSRFILSTCRATRIAPDVKKKKPGDKSQTPSERRIMAESGEDDEDEDVEEEEVIGEGIPDQKNKIGYKRIGRYMVLEGNSATEKPGDDDTELGVDHFAALIACLMTIIRPIEKWDTRTIDRVINIGKSVYDSADVLQVAKRRTIKNILLGNHFFDIIVKLLTIADYKHNINFAVGLKSISYKRKFIIVQMPQSTFVVYMNKEDGSVHLFYPYELKIKDGQEDKTVKASWIKFRNMRQMHRFVRQHNDVNKYNFYSFQVMNVIKAPRSVVISHQLQYYIRHKLERHEKLGRGFYERESWMDLHQNPWSRESDETASGAIRGVPAHKWYYWDIEYAKDLFSLVANLHQNSYEFPYEHRGKQTLCNCVLAIGMTGFYDLKEWNPDVIDTILVAGDKYFVRCTKDIKEPNYELAMEDLLKDCHIYPYKFQIKYEVSAEGTMFLEHSTKMNLYRAVRAFFEEYFYRAGVIIVSKNEKLKRIAAFGKRQENEYFLFDCQTFGPPMFKDREGAAYMLRCTTLARLVHVMVLTLRGGDFFIYDVTADNFEAMDDEDKEEDEVDPRILKRKGEVIRRSRVLLL